MCRGTTTTRHTAQRPRRNAVLQQPPTQRAATHRAKQHNQRRRRLRVGQHGRRGAVAALASDIREPRGRSGPAVICPASCAVCCDRVLHQLHITGRHHSSSSSSMCAIIQDGLLSRPRPDTPRWWCCSGQTAGLHHYTNAGATAAIHGGEGVHFGVLTVTVSARPGRLQLPPMAHHAALSTLMHWGDVSDALQGCGPKQRKTRLAHDEAAALLLHQRCNTTPYVRSGGC